MSRMLLLVGVMGFASGILCRSLFIFPWQILGLCLLLACITFGMWFVKRRLIYAGIALFLITFVFGAGRVALVPVTLPDPFVPLLDTSVVLDGRVVGEPDVRETTQRIPLRIAVDGVETKVLVVADRYPHVGYGDTIQVSGTLVRPEPFETDTGRTFRYDRFLAKDGIFALVARASVTNQVPNTDLGTKIIGALIGLKHAFQEGLARALPEPGASLASGLIAGGKQGLGTELLDLFIITGLVHIVVLSGYNVMIVAEGVLRAFGFLSKRSAAVLAGMVIALFVLVAGAGSASIRAGCMAGLALLARATGRTYAVVRALLIVGVVMLLINPLLLAYDPGFQLSFMATLGLILLAPILSGYLSWIPGTFWRELLAATLAAQIAVLPLLLYQTGLFSVVSLPANMLALPAVPLAMLLGLISGVVGMLVPALAPIIGLPAHLLLSYILGVASFFGNLPLAALSVPQFPVWIVAVAYVLLALWIRNAPEMQYASRARDS